MNEPLERSLIPFCSLTSSSPHPTLLQVAVGLGLVVSAGSLVLVPLLVAWLPDDYSARTEAPPLPWCGAHPLTRWALRIAKNLLGLVLFVAGIAMLVLPGQGLLTILAALILVDFPGKRRLERALVAKSRIRRALDWVRARAGAQPLVPPEASDGSARGA